jgi:hypothetical protein
MVAKSVSCVPTDAVSLPPMDVPPDEYYFTADV